MGKKVKVVIFLLLALAALAATEKRTQGNKLKYSEFVDDIPYEEDEEPEEISSRDDSATDETEDLNETGKHKYDKEQYWNEDDVEVEEEPLERRRRDLRQYERVYDDSYFKLRDKREVRYSNHRYDEPEDEFYEESRPVSRSVTPPRYKVYGRDEYEYIPAETIRRPVEKYVKKDGYFMMAPEPAESGVYYIRRDSPSVNERRHPVIESAGPPPVSRYVKKDEKDLSEAASGKSHHASADGKDHHKSSHHASGGGKDHHSKHSSSDGHKEDKGHKSVHHYDKGAKGHDEKEKHSKHYDEHGGKKHKEHDSAGHYGEHEEAAQGKKGAKFDEKKGHKKGHNTKGYHNKYHKDEYHKEHKFYDDYHKSGSHARYGKFNANHHADEGGHKKKHHLDQSHHENHGGKKGHHNKGHVDADHKGHKSSHGQEKHYAHHSDYAKKGGHEGGKSYGYQKKH